MMLPSALAPTSSWNANRPNSRPTGAPLMASTPPKLACTSTPTVCPPSPSGSRRELVPMPPFHPKATVPVPAPTLPSSTGPPEVLRSASKTCRLLIGRARIWFRKPSFVSPTTGVDRTDVRHARLLEERVHEGRRRPARRKSVHVRRIGVSNSPSSRTWVTPQELAEAVADVDRRRHAPPVHVPAVRQDRRHARPDRVALDHGGVPHPDVRHVGDGVERPRRQDPHDDAGLAGAGALRSGLSGGGSGEGEHEHRGDQAGRPSKASERPASAGRPSGLTGAGGRAGRPSMLDG